MRRWDLVSPLCSGIFPLRRLRVVVDKVDAVVGVHTPLCSRHTSVNDHAVKTSSTKSSQKSHHTEMKSKMISAEKRTKITLSRHKRRVSY